MNSNGSESFQIPKNSFTAFRLTYLPTNEVSEASKTILLGNSPHIYGNDKGPGLVKGSIRIAKSKARRTFDNTLHSISNQIYNEDNHITQNWFKFHNLNKFPNIIEDIQNEYLLRSSSEGEEDSDSYDDESTQDLNHKISTSTYNRATNESIISHGPSNETDTQSNLPDSLDSESLNHLQVIPDSVSQDSTIQSIESNFNYSLIEPKLSITQPNVKYDNMKNGRHNGPKRSSHIEIATPEPLADVAILSDYNESSIEKEQHRLRKKLRRFARLSKGRAKTTTNDIRYRIFKNIIKTFQSGDIILKERLLVLTKSTVNTTCFANFEENEPCDTRVHETWREYTAILRKSNDDSIVIQFYKIDQKSERPEYEYRLYNKVAAGIYSFVDKSISLTIPKTNWSTVHILKFHDNLTSMRWLYFIKQVLGNILSSDFSIYIPEVKTYLRISVPETIVLESIKADTKLTVTKISAGYSIKYTPLIQFLLDSIKQQILESKDVRLNNWLQSTIRPWFCFKYYDRLEWIFDDSEAFYIQNQILNSNFQLEIRDMSINKRSIKVCNDYSSPTPIEGFLSRLTDVGGNEQNLFRTFYKILYFHTSDNLLFFTQFYRGLPPENIKLANDVDSDVYHHNSFDLDEKEHIDWIECEDFKKFDKMALREFERKSQLAVKADSVIDLNQVIEIKKVSTDELKLPHKLLFNATWYGDTNKLEDEYLLDSVFEITTLNQGKIKLQAPNRKLRDLWISKLDEIQKYWKIRNQLEIEKINETRQENFRLLKIDEYTDSNITQECNYSEIKNSVANPYLNTIDNISLSNSIMISGYLYQKYKKHSNFNQYFAVLSSGSLILYSLYKRSKLTGEWKRAPYYQHHLSIPLRECYVYSGNQTSLDLLDRQKEIDPTDPGNKSLPRIYGDGWKSSEEESIRCFTLWIGRKRSISKENDINLQPKNPNLFKMIRKLGITGRSIVFMARSRQERELWVTRIYSEINRITKLSNM